MGKAPAFQYPNCVIHLDATYFLMATGGLDVGELGNFVRNLIKECQRGNFYYALSFPFITKVEKGYSKRKYIPIQIKRKILSFGKCQNCGRVDNLTVDHIIPLSQSGTDDPKNLQCLCWRCNRQKGPEKNGEKPSFSVLCQGLVK